MKEFRLRALEKNNDVVCAFPNIFFKTFQFHFSSINNAVKKKGQLKLRWNDSQSKKVSGQRPNQDKGFKKKV